MGISRIQLEEQLRHLRDQVNLMSARVEEDIRKVIVAARMRDLELARSVRAGDQDINAMQMHIEDKAAILLATQQPVASDLRELVTIIKVAAELERIGDYTAHLAKTIMKVGDGEEEQRFLAGLSAMADKGAVMLAQATAAVIGRDEDLARSCARLDAEINTMHRSIVAEILAAMKSSPDHIEIEARLLRTANFLERLGDHVTNICEAVVYMVSGVHVELND